MSQQAALNLGTPKFCSIRRHCIHCGSGPEALRVRRPAVFSLETGALIEDAPEVGVPELEYWCVPCARITAIWWPHEQRYYAGTVHSLESVS